MGRFNWWGKLKEHDGELFLGGGAVFFRVLGFMVDDQTYPNLFATFHGTADDFTGGLALLFVARYMWERTSD